MSPERVLREVMDVMQGPMEWGRSDCCRAACTVFGRLWGVDPMAPLPAYSGVRGARRMLEGRSMTETVTRVVRAAGLVEAQAHPGAFGLVTTQTEFSDVMPAICIRPGEWAGRTLDGFGLASHVTAIWGVPCRS